MKSIFIFIFLICLLNVHSQNKEYKVTNSSINDMHTTFGTTYYKNNFIFYSAPKKRLQFINKKRKARFSKRLKKMSVKRRKRVLRRKEKLRTNIIRKDFEFYIGFLDSQHKIIKTKRLGYFVNTTRDEVDLVFTNNFKSVYFTRNLSKNKKTTHLAIFKADVIAPGYWTNIVKLPINSANYSVGHPSLSQDGRMLYFVSNMQGSIGSLDIYKVKIIGENAYGKPINLGPKINTKGEETTPYIINNTLYFSSNKEGGLGNLDIYSINLLDQNAVAINLGKQINTNKNDLAFRPIKNSKKGYLTSNRNLGKGKYDLYLFEEIEEKKDIKKDIKKEIIKNVVAQTKQVTKNNIVKNKNEKIVVKDFTPKKEKIIKDTITKKEKAIVKSTILVAKNDQNKIIKDKKTIVKAPKIAAKKPIIKINKAGNLTLSEFNRCDKLLRKLNNVYFDYDKSYIRADAARELDNVISIMRKCPNIEILVTSHTDSRSSHKYNKTLSQRRAQSTVAYILRNGRFSPKKIKGIGYGETRLINKCKNGVICTKIEHQVNRRTEFEISNFY